MIGTILPDCYAAIFAALVIVAFIWNDTHHDDNYPWP
jgi:hypothetical protein